MELLGAEHLVDVGDVHRHRCRRHVLSVVDPDLKRVRRIVFVVEFVLVVVSVVVEDELTGRTRRRACLR